MKNVKYKVLNKKYDQNLGISYLEVLDLETSENFRISLDEDQYLIIRKNIDEKSIYYAYLDYIENNVIDYYYKKHQIEVVPEKYRQMYYYYKDYYNDEYQKEVTDKIDSAINKLEEVKDYLDLDGEESMGTYYNKLSRINSAEFELNKIRKLTK